MAKGSWWNKKKRNKRNNSNSNQDENADSGLKYVINKKSLDNQEAPASTSNYKKGYNFQNSNIPNSFNFNNNNSKHLRWNGNKPNYLNSAQNTNNREEGTSEPKKPPNKAMTNRYFSIENKISEGSVNCSEECTTNVDENENTKENSGENVDENDQESEQFIKKRDYLIKKLLQSRNLPETSTTTSALKHVTSNLESATINSEPEGDSSKKCTTENNTPQLNETSKNINESTNVKAKAALTTPAFQEDFIPLFSSKKAKEKSPAPKEASQSNDDEEENYGEIVLESYDHDEKDEEDVVDLTDDNEIIEVFNTVKKGKQIIIFD